MIVDGAWITLVALGSIVIMRSLTHAFYLALKQLP